MNVYRQSTEEDLLIIQWWARLQQSDEMNKMFANPHTPYSILKALQPPNVCLYELDGDGIWFMSWFEPTFTGAFFSVWIRPDRRKGLESYECFLKAADAGFSQFTTLMGVTKQEDLLPLHEKLGYTILCKVPELFGGLDAWVVLLDKEKIRGRIRKQRRWRGEEWRPDWLWGPAGERKPVAD